MTSADRDDELRSACLASLPAVYGDTPDTEVLNRLRDELDLFIDRGHSHHILVAADAARSIRAQGILLGNGSGPLTGSLVCYILGIRSIDPVASRLISERLIRSTADRLWLDFILPSSRLEEVSQPETRAHHGRPPITHHHIVSQDIKFSVWGDEHLDVIERTIALVCPGADPNEYVARIRLDEEAVFSELRFGKAFGKPDQWDAPRRALFMSIAPRSLEELAVVLALFHPSRIPLLERHALRSKEPFPVAGVPEIDDVLEPTRGLVVYHEQIMRLAMTVGGMTAEDADEFAWAVRHRSWHTLDAEDRFFAGAARQGHAAETAQFTWTRMIENSSMVNDRATGLILATRAYWEAHLNLHSPEQRGVVQKWARCQ